MKISVFGANGKVGRLIVDLALEQGYQVVAFVHSQSTGVKNANLKEIQGDIYDFAAVRAALKDVDLVISSLGSWHTPKKDILSEAMKNIIPAMEKQKIKKIISLTGADARLDGDELSPLHKLSHIGIKLSNGKILKDSEVHMELLQRSSLDWTVVRAPIMNNLGNANKFDLTNTRPLPWQTINRQSVAQAIINLVEENKYNKSAPFIIRS